MALLDAAVIAVAVGVFEAQAHLWTIFLQVEELLAVERPPTLPGEHGGTSQKGENRQETWRTGGETHCRMNWTASSYFIPHSINASATRTGALSKQKHVSVESKSEICEQRTGEMLSLAM